MMDSTSVAYTAGVIDGEGCIGVYCEKKRRGLLRYRLVVEVTNTEQWLVQWLYLQWGGSVVYYVRGRRNRSIMEWKWRICAQQAKVFLEDILPYLQIKGTQAKIAIAFQARKKVGVRKTAEVKTLEEIDYFLLGKLKKPKDISQAGASPA